MLAFALSLGIRFLVFSIIVAFIPGFQLRNFENQLFLFNGFRTIAIIILIILIGAYMNCQNGLAWEIMSSGDMFTQLKSSFAYFKRYWWQYSIISILLFAFQFNFPVLFAPGRGPAPISPVFSIQNGILYLVIGFIIEFLWQILITQTLPSITAQGNFRHAFIESWRMIKANFPRLFSTWGIYYLIFYLAPLVLNIIIIVQYPNFQMAGNPLDILRSIFILFEVLIGFPFRALLATGLYNNIKFDHFPTVGDCKIKLKMGE